MKVYQNDTNLDLGWLIWNLKQFYIICSLDNYCVFIPLTYRFDRRNLFILVVYFTYFLTDSLSDWLIDRLIASLPHTGELSHTNLVLARYRLKWGEQFVRATRRKELSEREVQDKKEAVQSGNGAGFLHSSNWLRKLRKKRRDSTRRHIVHDYRASGSAMASVMQMSRKPSISAAVCVTLNP